MDLKDIASVSGKRGLYKVLKPTRSGVILETLDETRKKLVASANSRVSILKEISIYTTGAESSVLLEDVFMKIHAIYGFELTTDAKSDDASSRMKSDSATRSAISSSFESFPLAASRKRRAE